MEQENLEKLFTTGKFSDALQMLLAGEKLPDSLQPHQKSQILGQLFREEQYDIILHLIKDKTIETDIYEFDHFDSSVFQTVVECLKADEKGLDFFKTFISKLTTVLRNP